MDRSNRKVLVVSNMYPSEKYPHYGIFVKHSARVLEKAGYRVDTVAMRKTIGSFKKLLAYLSFYTRVLMKGLLGRYDAIYAHYASHTALPLLILRKLKKIPIVMNVHGNDVIPETAADEKFQSIVKQVLDASTAVICPSEYFRGCLTERFGVSPDKIRVYPSGGVNTDMFCPMPRSQAAAHLKLPEQDTYIGYISRIEEKKGWDLFLRGCHKLLQTNPQLKLIVVGDGDQMPQYQQLVAQLGLSDSIIKYDLLAQQQIAYIYNLLDVYVFPTYRESESLGLVGLEAMACQTLTVLPDRYGPASYGIHGENALVFRSGDSDSLYETLVAALAEDHTLLCQNARRTALQYNQNHTDPILVNFFDSLPVWKD